ncbi:MAG: SAM-dependent methyltransferase [Pseudomonadota bacterium]
MLDRDLSAMFRRLIRETGPISLAQYMGESNARYYSSRDPLGTGGDFITAPEISQMFGELIGLWLADMWAQMGGPAHVYYVELGPGRGTLASDALRTAARFGLDPQVHFVEGSESLRAIQSGTMPGVIHHDDLASLPDDAPILLVANEFFDALPIRQLVRTDKGWRERMVGLDGERFIFVAGDKPMDDAVPESARDAEPGSLIETSPAASTVMGEIASRLAGQGGAGLVIDYGARKLRPGSTLQAIRAHKKVDVFAAPGEADLTAHVDFSLLNQVAQNHKANVLGIARQGQWLRRLGIDARLEALQAASAENAEKLQRQRDRLVEAEQMGDLFKVMALSGGGWPERGGGFA